MEFLNDIQLTGNITNTEGKVINMGGGTEGIIRPTGMFGFDKDQLGFDVSYSILYGDYLFYYGNASFSNISVYNIRTKKWYYENSETNIRHTFNDAMNYGYIPSWAALIMDGRILIYLQACDKSKFSTPKFFLYGARIDTNMFSDTDNFSLTWERMDVTNFVNIYGELVELWLSDNIHMFNWNEHLCILNLNKTTDNLYVYEHFGSPYFESKTLTIPTDVIVDEAVLMMYHNKLMINSRSQFFISDKAINEGYPTSMSLYRDYQTLYNFVASNHPIDFSDSNSGNFIVKGDYVYVGQGIINIEDGSFSYMFSKLTDGLINPIFYNNKLYSHCKSLNRTALCSPEYEVLLNLDSNKIIHCSNIISIEGAVSKVDDTTYTTTSAGDVIILTTKPVRVE